MPARYRVRSAYQPKRFQKIVHDIFARVRPVAALLLILLLGASGLFVRAELVPPLDHDILYPSSCKGTWQNVDKIFAHDVDAAAADSDFSSVNSASPSLGSTIITTVPGKEQWNAFTVTTPPSDTTPTTQPAEPPAASDTNAPAVSPDSSPAPTDSNTPASTNAPTSTDTPAPDNTPPDAPVTNQPTSFLHSIISGANAQSTDATNVPVPDVSSPPSPVASAVNNVISTITNFVSNLFQSTTTFTLSVPTQPPATFVADSNDNGALTCADFSAPTVLQTNQYALGLSLGWQANGGTLKISMSQDGTNWEPIGTIDGPRASNGSPTYYSLPMPADFSISSVSTTKIRFDWQGDTNNPKIFLDSFWIDAAGPAVISTNAPTLSDNQNDFDASSTPTFEISVPSSSVSVLNRLFSFIQPVDAQEEGGATWHDPQVLITARVLDENHADTAMVPTIARTGWGAFTVALNPREFKPGSYILQTTIAQGLSSKTLEQPFTWGVLVVNTDQAVYKSGDTASLAFGVLNNDGDTICDASLQASIRAPDGSITSFSTSDNTITRSTNCGRNSVTDTPDYAASYKTSAPGTYRITVIATTDAGTHTIYDSFVAVDDLPYRVKRTGASRIWPQANYTMKISVTPEAAFSGTVTEYVPASFAITPQDGLTVTTEGDQQALAWIVNLNAGETRILSYEYNPPDISPTIFRAGELELTPDGADAPAFTETRYWQIASDSVTATQKDHGNNPTNGTSFTSNAYLPVVNRLYLAWVCSTSSNANLDTPTLGTGNGLTWAQVGTTLQYNTQATPTQSLSLWRALKTSGSLTNNATTITFTKTQTSLVYTIEEYTNVDTSGTNGSGAVVQSNTNFNDSNATTSLSVTLSALASSNNMTVGGFCNGINNTGSLSVGSGYTGDTADTQGSPNTTIKSEFKAAGSTTVNMTTTASYIGAIAAEIRNASITVSGTVYTDEATTKMTTGRTVKLLVNGASAVTTTMNSTCPGASCGQYSFSSVSASIGSVITIFISGATENATTVTLAPGTGNDDTGVDLYQDRVIVRSDQTSTSITNTNLDQYDYLNNGDANIDGDVGFQVSSGTLTVSNTRELHVWTGDTFAPGGTVLISGGNSSPQGDLHVVGTLSTANDVEVDGGDITGSGTITQTAGTTTIHGTGSLGGGTYTFFHLTLGDLSTTATTTTAGDFTVSGTLTVQAHHTLTGTNNITVDTNVLGGGTINLTGGTFKQVGSTANNFGASAGSNDWTFNALTFDNQSVTTTITVSATGTGQIIVTSTLTVGGSGSNVTTLDDDANNRIIAANGGVTITSKGTLLAPPSASFTVGSNWSNSGTFTHENGTVTFNGSGASETITTGGSQFYNLTFNNASGGWALQDTTTVANDVTVTAGALSINSKTFNVNHAGGTDNTGITGAGTIYCGNGNNTCSAGTTTFTNTTNTSSAHAAKVGDTGSFEFYILAFSGNSGYTKFGGNLTAANAFLCGNGTSQTCDTSSSNYSLTATKLDVFSASGGSTPTFTANGSSITLTANAGLELANFLNSNLKGVMNANTATITMSGTVNGFEPLIWVNTGTLNIGTSTFILDDTSGAQVPSGPSYYNLQIGDGTDTGSTSFAPDGALTITNVLRVNSTLALGALGATVGTTTSSGFIIGTGTITQSSSATTLIQGAGNIGGTGTTAGTCTGSTTSFQFYNLTVGDGAHTNITTLCSDATVSNTFTIAGSQTFDNKANTLTLSASGTPMTRTGTFTGSTGTVKYTSASGIAALSSAAMTGTNAFYNLTLSTSSGSNQTFTANVDATVSNVLNIDTHSIFSLGSTNLTLAGTGTPITRTGTFTAGTSTVNYTSGSGVTALSSAAMTSSNAFYNLTINGTGTFTAGVDVTATNTLTMTAGTLAGTNNVTVNADAVGTAGVINLTGGTFEQRVAANQNFGPTTSSTNWTFNNLKFTNSSGAAAKTVTAQSCSTCGVTVSSVLTIGSGSDSFGTTLSTGDKTWTLSGTGTPLSMASSPAATFTGATSTFSYTGSSASALSSVAMTSGNKYYNLTTNSSGTITAGVAVDVANILTVSGGTLDMGANNFNVGTGSSVGHIVGAGSITQSSSATTTMKGDGNLGGTSSATAGTCSGTSGTYTFYNLTVGDASNTKTTTLCGDVTVSEGFTIATSQTFDNGTKNLTLAGDSTPLTRNGTFTHSTGTVTYTDSGNGVLSALASAAMTGSNAFYNLTINNSSVTFLANVDIDATNIVTVTAGTLNMNTNNLTVGTGSSNGHIVGAGAISQAATATTTMKGAGNLGGTSSATAGTCSGTSGNFQFYNLTVGDVSNTKTTTLCGAVNVSNVFTIATNQTLDGKSFTLTLSGSVSTPMTRNGTFTASTSTVTYSGGTVNTALSSAAMTGSNAFYNLTLSGSSTKTAGVAVDVGNILTVTSTTLAMGANNFNVGTGSANGHIVGSGSITQSSSATTTMKGAGNLGGTSSATAGTCSGSSGSYQFYNLTVGDASNTKTTTLCGDVTVSNVFTVATSQTFDNKANNLTLSGTTTPITRNGTFTGSTGTVTYTSGSGVSALSSAAMTSSNAFYNLTINGTGTFTAGVDITAKNNLTMTGGTLAGTNNVIVNADAIGTAGVINLTGGTFEQRVAANQNFGPTTSSTNWTFSSLTLDNSSGSAGKTITTQSCSTCGVTVSSVLTIGKGTDTQATTLNAGDKTWTLSGSGTPLTRTTSPNATFTASTSTVTYTSSTGASAVANADMTGSNGFYNITFNSSGQSFSQGRNIDVANVFTIASGTTFVAGISMTVTLSGSGTPLVRSGTFTASNAGTVTYTSGSGVTALASAAMTGSNAFNNLTINGTGTFTVGVDITVAAALTMTSGTLAGTNNVTVAGNAAGTAGVINMTGGTFEQAMTGNSNFGPTTASTNWTFNNLTFSDNTVVAAYTATAQSCSTCGVTVTSVLKIGKATDSYATTLNAGDKTWTLSGSGTPITRTTSPAAVFTGSTSTVTFTSGSGVTALASAAMTGSNAFYNLTINGSGTFTAGVDVTATHNLAVTAGTLAGTNNVTVNGDATGAGTVNLTGGTFLQRVAAAQNFGANSGSNDWTFNNLSFENSSSSDRTVTIAGTGTGQVIVSGTLTVGNASDTNVTTLDDNANNRIIDENGAVTITSKGTLLAPPGASFTVAGNFTNNGTFTNESGTVTFDTTGTSTLAGSGSPAITFNNVTVTTPGKTMTFTAGETFRTNGVLTVRGSSGSHVAINSSSGSQWFINHQGTESVEYATITNSGCDGSSTYISLNDTSTDGGNNGSCWLFVSLSFTLDSTSKSLTLNSGNTYTNTATSTLTVSTTGVFGYQITAFETGLLTAGSNTISDWSGTNATPTTWTGTCSGSSQCGFGYSTNDSDLSQFSSTKYAGFTQTGPGDIVAQANAPVTNDATTITYRASVTNLQAAGVYQTTVRYVVTPQF